MKDIASYLHLLPASNSFGFITAEIIDGGLAQDIEDWNALAENSCSDTELLKSIFERGGWAAAVDFPASMCWEQLSVLYPNAKVVHTERTSPEKWWESATGSILVVHTIFPINILNRLVPFWVAHHKMADAMWSVVAKKTISDTHPGWPDVYKKDILAGYSANSQRVREVVPSERLLIQDHSQGWKLLAEFLGKDIPDKPYPHVNTRADWQAFFRNLSIGVSVAFIVSIGAVALVLRKIIGMLTGGKKNKAE